MKQLIYCLLICCCYALRIQAGVVPKADSLQQVLATLPHDTTRLQVIQDILRIEQSNPKCIHFSNMLLKEAKAQKNARYAGVALYFQVIYYYNQNELDSVNKRLAPLESYARKSPTLLDYYFDAIRCQIDLHCYREQFEFSVNKSLEMHEKAKGMRNVRGQIGAYQCLANAYMGTGRMEEAKKSLEKGHKLLPQLENIVVRNSVLVQLIVVSYEMEDYTGQIKYLKEQADLLNSYIKSQPGMKEAFNDPYLFNEIYQTYYFNAMQQPKPALEHLTAAKNHLTPNSYFMYKVLYNDANAAYYRLCHSYDNALLHIDSTIVALQKDFNSDYIHQINIKADILTEAGRSREALPLYQKVLQAKDSLENAISNKQMQLIQEDYHVDKLVLEKGQARNRIQLIALSVILLGIIALSFFMVRMFRVRKALKSAEQQTRETTRIAEEANEMKNRFLTNMSYNIRIPLNGVVGFSQFIASEPDMDEETRREYSAIIQKNSEELMRLVNDVLDLSRLEAGMMKFQMQEYDILALCNDAIYRTRMEAEAYIHIDFRTNIEEIQILWVDTTHLTRALLSALTYPVKSEQKRTISFTLTLDTEAELVRFVINNSPLADPDFLSQEVSIRHDINRLLLAHFGGSYAVQEDAPEGSTIVFTYPLNISG